MITYPGVGRGHSTSAVRNQGGIVFTVIDLTQPLSPATRSYPGDAAAYRAYTTRIEGSGGVVTHLVRFDLHSGTHMDAPRHFAPSGSDIAAVPLRVLPMHVVHVHERRIDTTAVPEICEGSAILFHTGWERHAGTSQYFSGFPFLTEAAAQLLVDRNAALVGLDSPSADDRTDSAVYPAHDTLCGAGIPIVEGLVNLKAIPFADDAPVYFAAFPLPFEGLEACPVRAVAIVGRPDWASIRE